MPDNDQSELTFDEEWEADAEQRLEMVEYDTELGKQLGRDAQRMAAGELSPSEFHEKYHEAVVEEFGVDNRGDVTPPKSEDERFGYDTETPEGGGGGGNGQTPGVPGEDDPSRRDVMKTAGVAGAAAVGLSAFEGTAQRLGDDTDDDEDLQWGMAINQNNCIACLNCIEACNEENNNTPDALWMFVHRYVEEQYTDDEESLTRPCQHCSDAPCTAACPVASRHTRDEDGIVLTDYETCIGCRYCEVACPYGVNYLQWATPREREEFKSSGISIESVEPDDPEGESADGISIDSEDDGGIRLDSDPNGGIQLASDEGIELDSDQEVRFDNETNEGIDAAGNPPKGVMGKCTFCVHRQDSEHEALVGTTACEDVCPTDAIHFGNMEDEDSDPRQHLDSIDEDESTFRLLEDHGTEPNIVYVGNEPSAEAEPVDGPRTVEDMNRDLQTHRTDRTPVTDSTEDEA